MQSYGIFSLYPFSLCKNVGGKDSGALLSPYSLIYIVTNTDLFSIFDTDKNNEDEKRRLIVVCIAIPKAFNQACNNNSKGYQASARYPFELCISFS